MRNPKRADKENIAFYVIATLMIIDSVAMYIKYGWVSTWNHSQSEIMKMQLDLWFGWL